MVGTSSFQLLSNRQATQARYGPVEVIFWKRSTLKVEHCWINVESNYTNIINKFNNHKRLTWTQLDSPRSAVLSAKSANVSQVLWPRLRSPWCFACGCTECNTGANLLCHLTKVQFWVRELCIFSNRQFLKQEDFFESATNGTYQTASILQLSFG